MSTAKKRIDIVSQFRSVKLIHITMFFTFMGVGTTWYLNIMGAIQEGKIDKQAIIKSQADVKSDMQQFRTEIGAIVTAQNTRIDNFITANIKK